MKALTSVWLLIERPSPAEEAEVLGASNDEVFVKGLRDTFRTTADGDQTYWVECKDYVYI
jgi:hypothetical protein